MCVGTYQQSLYKFWQEHFKYFGQKISNTFGKKIADFHGSKNDIPDFIKHGSTKEWWGGTQKKGRPVNSYKETTVSLTH